MTRLSSSTPSGLRRQPLYQLPKFAGSRLLRKHRAHLQCIQHLLQLGNAFVLGLTVHAIQAARLGETQRHRRLDIGGDHAFLDQTVRIVARHRIEPLDFAVAADARLDFAAAKIQRAARVARLF